MSAKAEDYPKECATPEEGEGDGACIGPKENFGHKEERKRGRRMVDRLTIQNKRKSARHAKADRLREQWEMKSESERESAKAATALAKQQVEDRLQWGLEHGLNVCVDLSYEAEHSEREKQSICKQLQLSYNVLKRSAVPVHLHITSLGCLSVGAREGLQQQGLSSWKVDSYAARPWEVFSRESLVFLSPDAPQVLLEFDSACVYVVGGIVDKTVRKAVTLGAAREAGVRAMRLPIQEYLPQRATHILNIDSCVHTICRYLEVKDWPRTLLETVPKRRQSKGVAAINAASEMAASGTTNS